MQSPGSIPRPIPRSVHPIHLHGRDFAMLAQGDGYFNTDVVPSLDNPARRDALSFLIGGYVRIAFKINYQLSQCMADALSWCVALKR
jgi:hypothetical protein